MNDVTAMEEINEDWHRVKKRWEAWWNQELYDRVLLQVRAPRAGAVARGVEQVDPQTQWTSIEHIIRRELDRIRATYWGGEMLPAFWHGLSVGHALPFGCTPRYARETMWVDPAPDSGDGFPSLDGWRTSPWWDWLLKSTEKAAGESKGRYFVLPMWGNHAADTLALIRGPQQLVLDCVENPDWVKLAVEAVSEMLIELFEQVWRLTAPQITGLEGSLDYASCWSPGRTMGFDCDISCMLSPRMFAELFLPPLIGTMRTVDHGIYHLDGHCATQHLGLLLDLPELHAIQWVPGAGREAILQWVPLIRRVQEKRKSIVVSAGPEEIEPLLDGVRPEGLCICTWCESEAEARELTVHVATLTAKRRC